MGPAQCRHDRALSAQGIEKPVIAAIGVGLEDASKALEMAPSRRILASEKGMALKRLKRYEEAVQVYSRWIEAYGTGDLGEVLMKRLSEAFSEHPNAGDIRGRGLFAAVEFVSDRESKAGFDDQPRLAEELRLAAMDEGLICYPGSITVDGRTVPHVMLAPPMISTEEQLEEGVARLRAAVGQIESLAC